MVDDHSPKRRSGFDKLARSYRWLEYATFGPLLMRCRLQYLPELSQVRRALVVGDGDGRFSAALLCQNERLHVDAVDSSGAMLELLRRRANEAGRSQRLTTHLQDARSDLPAGPFDLVCTHFFLDCLTEAEVTALAAAVRQRMPSGQWIVSEFAVPRGAARWPAAALVATLYAVFAVLTGLRVRSLPDYASALQSSGFHCVASRARLFGLLRAELWQGTE